MGRLGELPDIVLGGIATVRQAPDGPPGQLLGHEIEDITGQLTAGTIRHVELVGLRFFKIEFEADRNAEAVAGPTLERQVHHAPIADQAPPRTVFLAGWTRDTAGAGEA